MKKPAVKKLLVAVLGLVGAFGVFSMPAHAEDSWGPRDRETFTWEVPASYRTFNSITNNPSLGDERNFVRVREYGTNNDYVDEVNIEVGKTYEVYVYFHNNAADNLNASGAGIADNVRLAMEMPTEVNAGEAAVVKGTISSTNTNPGSVYDTAFLTASETVYLRYVQGSAEIHNGGSANGKFLDDASLWGTGAKLAFWDEEWGMIPGCNQYAGYVTFRVKVDQPRFYISKEISVDGGKTWSETATVKPGDTVKFRIKYQNIGTTNQTSVTVYDVLADGMTLVAGTIEAKIPANANYVKVDDSAWENGLGIGDYLPEQEGFVVYDVKIEDNKGIFACGNTVVYNNAYVTTANGTMYDKVKLTVERGCDNGGTPSELPDTGPAEIILAVIVALAIGTGGYYLIKSSTTLHNIKKAETGKEKVTHETKKKAAKK
ncbi:DUF11 domain-containing protein [Candidatus Saccharibacteria bacterium]|nr:DUF11 domain-containing protein [Candidatus Saccharibacteria bacterium]